MDNLLNKTLRANLVYGVITLLIAAPLFYYSTELLYLEDADEALVLHKTEFEELSLPMLVKSDIQQWNEFNRDIKIKEDIGLAKEELFHTFFYDSLSKENEPYRVLQAPIQIQGEPYTLEAKINLVEQEDLIVHIALLFFSLAGLLFIGWYVISKMYSKKMWKPFYETLELIEKIEIDKKTAFTFTPSRIQEFNSLNESVKRLYDKNKAIYESQKEFVENAAHELQTPLAIFQGSIDNIIQDSSLEKSQSEQLIKLSNNVARLKKINKNLLLLSKIGGNSFIEKEEVSFNSILKTNINFYQEQCGLKSITLKVHEEEDIRVFSNAFLVETLLNNLIMNAINHNILEGVIEVVLGESKIIVSNTGNPVPLNNEKLFNRFYKANSSEKGNGLGLSIVKKIADINRWVVTYNFDKSRHIFSLTVS